MTTVSAVEQPGVAALPGKYLTFCVGEELYGLEILKVQEIIGLMTVTHVPRTPSFVRGVINLRGRIIPVVDLRSKFDLEPKEDTERTCIVVVQVERDHRSVVMGLLVDEVSEVINVQASQLEPTPSLGADVDTAFLVGLAKVNQKVVMLLDVDRVLAAGDGIDLEALGASESE